MKLSEMRPCAKCHGKVAPIWYVLRVSQAMINPRAGNQVLGMMQMLGGNLALAETIAPEPDCVLVMGDKEPALMTELNLCQGCFMEGGIDLALLMEASGERDESCAEKP